MISDVDGWRGELDAARRLCQAAEALFPRHPRARWPLHTSVIEGINNKIKVIKRMAYGFRDDDYFFLKIRATFPGNTG